MTTENYSAPDEAGFGQTSGEGTERTYATKPGDALADVAGFFNGNRAQGQPLLDDNPELSHEGEPLPPRVRLHIPEDPKRGETVASAYHLYLPGLHSTMPKAPPPSSR